MIPLDYEKMGVFKKNSGWQEAINFYVMNVHIEI